MGSVFRYRPVLAVAAPFLPGLVIYAEKKLQLRKIQLCLQVINFASNA